MILIKVLVQQLVFRRCLTFVNFGFFGWIKQLVFFVSAIVSKNNLFFIACISSSMWSILLLLTIKGNVDKTECKRANVCRRPRVSRFPTRSPAPPCFPHDSLPPCFLIAPLFISHLRIRITFSSAHRWLFILLSFSLFNLDFPWLVVGNWVGSVERGFHWSTQIPYTGKPCCLRALQQGSEYLLWPEGW